jgi:hypothetical protein
MSIVATTTLVTTPNVDTAGANGVVPNVKVAVTTTPDAAPKLPSGQIQQRQEQYCYMTVTNLSYKQWLETARARIARKVQHKVTMKKQEVHWTYRFRT